MLSLFFEVEVKPGHLDQYLQLAAALRPELDALGGCLFLDRFKSLSRANLILSYQIWQDEGAMTAWRVHAHHHDIQTLGRDKVFSDYRLRVAELVHEARPGQAAWVPERRGTYNDPKRRAPTYVLVLETAEPKLNAVTGLAVESFSSVYREGRFAHLLELPDEATGLTLSAQLLSEPGADNIRVVEVARDYGMYDRREAPQYYPEKSRDG
ncbi:antibiotic biosynthesis monooxygenase family protein [Bradyrhizobium aeschynomenes]|uniref:antibiotic biosynthesis monooxygenase family protein n=1 Tax=Bradyrhizobium aeschynomenes TaxID=2734909 RepID=UPI001553C9D7|nr:antibiotic biosynthesis monooxygenase family protein [Bradyrhizobium aeschynomenes]NPV23115.1 antibiotic biosynthesis monooxygenase [Bradyrhizobium aeschynomenes]